METPIDHVRWESQIDLEPFYSERIQAVHGAFDEEEFGEWLVFICQNTPIRRALHDAVQALRDPVEAFVYIYRGFEWIRKGMKLSWADIAGDLGIPEKEIRKLGQIANDESGVRHASKSGGKQRASLETYGTWIAGLIDVIEAGRARLDKKYKTSDPKRVAEILKVAVQYDPYP